MDYNRLEGRKAIQRIAAQMIRRKKAGKTTALLLGAGVSRTAGIPSANGFVEIIKKEYNDLVEDNDTTYQQCMGKLSREQIKELMNRYKDNKVNPAHFYLSLLVEEDKDKKVFVDSLLTVNFDKLILKSLALYNIYPTVFDSAASKSFSPGGVSYPCIFHLHGQMGNIALLNDAEEMKEHSKGLRPVLHEVFSKNCLWIVVGYSGECDPVLDVLSETQNFDNELYWIAYKDNEPKPFMSKILEPKSRGVYYVNGFVADSFFKELTNELKLQSKILTNPFSHFYDTLNKIEITKIDDKETEPFKIIKQRVKSAIEVFEEGNTESVLGKFNKPKYDKQELIQRTSAMWLFGDDKEIDEIYEEVTNSNIKEAKVNLSYAYFNRGLSNAKKNEYDKAMIDFNKAIELNPKNDAVFSNRGLISVAKHDYENAIKDFNKAIKINIKNSDAYLGRGLVYYINKDFRKSIEDFTNSIKFKPRQENAHSSRGSAYSSIGDYEKAIEDFKISIELKSDDIATIICLIELYIFTGRYRIATESLTQAYLLKPDLKNSLILSYLDCIIRKLMDKDTSDSEKEFEYLLKEDIILEWSFVEIEKWLSKTRISKDKKEYIKVLIDKMKVKLKV